MRSPVRPGTGVHQVCGASPRIPLPADVAEGYDNFALAYSLTMAEDFARRALPILDGLLLNALPSRSRVLDLGCGSGQLARALLARGMRVTGLDISQTMLALARRNAPEALLIAADIRYFGLKPVHDAAIAAFNTLAHVKTQSGLECVFANAKRALRPRARLVFDLTMEEGYRSKWQGEFQLEAAGLRCLVRPSYDAASRWARNDITVWRNNSAISAQPPCSFTIWQKCHSEAEVRQALIGAGFRSVKGLDASGDLDMEETGRRFFLASNARE